MQQPARAFGAGCEMKARICCDAGHRLLFDDALALAADVELA